MNTMNSIRGPKAGAPLIVLAMFAMNCGSSADCRDFNIVGNASIGGDAGITNECIATLVDADVLRPDGIGSAGALVVPCEGKAGAWVVTSIYGCGTCGGDLAYPVVCSHNQLACPTSYKSSQGSVIDVSPNSYVVNLMDTITSSGQCSYMKTYQLPGFILHSRSLTNREAGAPILLRAVSSGRSSLPSFNGFFVDRALGEKAIHALVTIVDLATGTPIEYTIGNPEQNKVGMGETLALIPVAPLAPNHGYRVTIYPAEQQSFVACHTFGSGSTWLTEPESSDFYTYSRPMVGSMFIAYKPGPSGYLAFEFTEALVDLESYPAATVTVDGDPFPGCMMPYACSGSIRSTQTQLRLDSTSLPSTFTTIVLRIPHAVKSVNGGTILDGTRDNPYATIEGDVAVYTFKAEDFTWTTGNLTKTWIYRTPA